MKCLKFKLLLVIFLAAPVMISCSQDSLQNDTTNAKNESLIPDNLSISIDPSSPTTYKLDEIDMDQLLSQLSKELYEVDFKTEKEAKEGGDIFIGYDLKVNPDENTVIVYPIQGENPIKQTSGDDEKCGGKKGDGWTSYGVCHSKSCVEDKTAEAAQDLSENLVAGKCLDIRVKRNTLSARVSGRLIDC